MEAPAVLHPGQKTVLPVIPYRGMAPNDWRLFMYAVDLNIDPFGTYGGVYGSSLFF
jgi:hypothetical protein